jgi:hypothetical protein
MNMTVRFFWFYTQYTRSGFLKLWYTSHCSAVHGHSIKKKSKEKNLKIPSINAVT